MKAGTCKCTKKGVKVCKASNGKVRFAGKCKK